MTLVFGISSDICEDMINYLYRFTSESVQKKAGRFVFPRDSARCLLGNLLARYALCMRLKCKNEDLAFSADAFGKPCLLKPGGTHFNVSHSGDWVVCAVSDKPVGIDVEHVRDIDMGIAGKFFSRQECSDLAKQPANERLWYFYSLWTLKESYIKADGRGLSIPLDSFSMVCTDNGITLVTDNAFSSCFFRQYRIDEAYVVSVCSVDPIISDSVKFVSLGDIIESLG